MPGPAGPAKSTSFDAASGRIAETPVESHTSAPAAVAERSSASETAPAPPRGTSEEVPSAWRRKARFWRSEGSSSEAKVPETADDATRPRTVSEAKRRDSTAPSGAVTRSRQVAGSTCAATSRSQGSGSSRVGVTARDIAATSEWKLHHASYSRLPSVSSRKEVRVGRPSVVSTTSPRCRPSTVTGTYAATGRGTRARSSSRSATSRGGSSDTVSA